MVRVLCIYLFLTLSFLGITLADTNVNNAKHLDNLTKPAADKLSIKDNIDVVLTTLEGAIKFFREEYENLNLDAIIGTRLVEGKSILFI